MSKRRRQIKKQRKASEQVEAERRIITEHTEAVREQVQDEDLVLPREERPREMPEEVHAPVVRADPAGSAGNDVPTPVPDGWFAANKENFLLGLLVLYVLLLGLGTVGELFEVEWILNLPIFR